MLRGSKKSYLVEIREALEMTLQECYDQMNGSYDDAKARLMMDSMIERFLQKFLEDKTMEELRRAVASGDIPGSFRQAHTPLR